MAQRGQPAPHAMAAKEELYSKVIPRRNRQHRAGTIKHGSSLEILLSMGFPKARAQKALASTGGRSVQAACDWLFSHVGDPFLDDTLPREYVLYLRPTGPLAQKLSEFWQQSKQICGKNKAHNIFPHITLCQFFMCEDSKVDALTEALQATVMRWKCKFPAPLPLELYTSSNFIGLFVKEESAEVLKKFAADFAAEAASKADVHVEPHKKQLHVTLAYHFQTSHLPTLEKLAQNIDVKLGCDWVAAIFSRDIRFVNHETLQVIYPYTPQNDDELELVPGDFIFMSPVEQTSTSEGWIYGISLATGCSGLLPENYITKADECGTWVFHGYVKLLSPTLVTAKRELSSCDFTWVSEETPRAAEKVALGEAFWHTNWLHLAPQPAFLTVSGNNILIVAHASSLEACTCQLQGLSPQNSKDFVQMVRKIPYLGFCSCEELGDTGVWQLTDPPILPLTHGPTGGFNWRETLLQE
uniref:Ubiquitin associated and SH3 domain containing B n=1 Tax=Pavo cristatus TaxID=9049 RepID=A0A8C9G024_PAVCR